MKFEMTIGFLWCAKSNHLQQLSLVLYNQSSLKRGVNEHQILTKFIFPGVSF